MSHLSDEQHRNVNGEDVLGHFYHTEHLKVFEPVMAFGKRKEPFNHTTLPQVVLPLGKEEQRRQEFLATFPEVVVNHKGRVEDFADESEKSIVPIRCVRAHDPNRKPIKRVLQNSVL